MFSRRVVVGPGSLVLAVAIWSFQPLPHSVWRESGTAFGQAGEPRNPMRERMRQMMPGLIPPPGMTPERLPAPESVGAGLTVRYCTQCHDLPSPWYKTADQWPAVFDRMLRRMEMMGRGGMMGRGMMGMGSVRAPSSSEAVTILRYLKEYSMRVATSAELAIGDPAHRGVFQAVCSQCHVLPSPTLHLPQEWAAVVARMQGNMQLMKKRVINEQEREAIILFLMQAATKML